MTTTPTWTAPAGAVSRTEGSHPEGGRTEGSHLEGSRTGGRTVVVGVDDSPGGLAALHWAMDFAQARGASLVAVRTWALGLPRHGGRRHRAARRNHVVLTFLGNEPRKAAEQVVRTAFRAAGGAPAALRVTVRTPEGDPGRVLTAMASAPGDVLVVGTAGRPTLKRAAHGSVGSYCLRHARCPVVVISARSGQPAGPAVSARSGQPAGPAVSARSRHSASPVAAGPGLTR